MLERNLLKTMIASAALLTSLSAFAESITTNLLPDPPAMGKQELEIKVQDSKGKPSKNATIDVQVIMPEMKGMMPAMNAKTKIEQKSPGVFLCQFNLSMEGEWYVKVMVKNSGKNEEFIYQLTTGTKGLKSVSAIPATSGSMDHMHH